VAPPSSSDSSVSKELASQQGAVASGIPDFARPLAAHLSAADVHVRWGFSQSEWFQLHALIKDRGIPAMAAVAIKAAGRARVESARYFLPGWRELPPLPAPGDERPVLRAVPTTRSTTDERVAAGLALAEKYEAEERAALEAAPKPQESA
jgi:hypothetical protein